MQDQAPKESTPPLRPWHRQPGETARRYEAFKLYLDGLTQVEVANKLYKRGQSASKPLHKKPLGQIAKWASKNQWVQRRLDYTDHLNRIREEEIETQQKEQAVDWARRQAALDEQTLVAAETILVKVKEMLAYPLTREVGTTVEYHDDEKKYPKTVHVFEPARWSFNSIPALITVAKNLSDEVFSRRLADKEGRENHDGDLVRQLEESLEELQEAERLGEEAA